MTSATEVVAFVCLGWYFFIALVCAVGCVQIFRFYSSPPPPSISSSLPDDDAPHVTIIRPCKGQEPYLYECLASSLQQNYPRHKLTVYFCVATRDDSACQTITKVLTNFKQHDARLFVEEQDPALQPDETPAQDLGPNPKIRNMSRAYREAKGDLVWILDCNIWTAEGVCGRMVDRLCGYSPTGTPRPFKFVHQLPVAIDVPVKNAFPVGDERGGTQTRPQAEGTSISQHFGGRLDEAFLSSAHAKMYVAINAVAVAPCICGKSSMFRRSHLNALTNDDQSTETRFGSGIDYFSENICEDHLIGDLLWRAKIPPTLPVEAKTWKNHGLVYGDIALQPVAGMSVSNYIARRVRWLRVRKFTVPLATLVEPGTESLLCSFMGAFGLTTASLTKTTFGNTWQACGLIWLLSVIIWASVDRFVYNTLQSGKTIDTATSTGQMPPFVHPSKIGSRRSLSSALMAWLGREIFTLPVWTWAIWGGVTVIWRDKKLWVGLDMKVHEVRDKRKDEQRQPLLSAANDGPTQQHSIKIRQD